MKDILKTKKNSLIVAAVIFVILSGYCYIAGFSLIIPLLLFSIVFT